MGWLRRLNQHINTNNHFTCHSLFIQNRKMRTVWVRLNTTVLFGLAGLLSLCLCLNVIHLHRLVSFDESNNFPNMRGFECPRPEPMDSVQDETQKVSGCLIILDDNHFLISKEIHRETVNVDAIVVARNFVRQYAATRPIIFCSNSKRINLIFPWSSPFSNGIRSRYMQFLCRMAGLSLS